MKCSFFDVFVFSTSTLTSVVDVGDAKWILHTDAMWLKCIQVLHPSVLLFVDISRVHDFKDSKFLTNQSNFSGFSVNCKLRARR